MATGQPPRQDEKSNLGNYNHNNNTISANRSRNGSFDYDKYDDDFEDYQEEEEREFYEGGEHELSPEYIAHFGVPEDYKRGSPGINNDDYTVHSSSSVDAHTSADFKDYERSDPGSGSWAGLGSAAQADILRDEADSWARVNQAGGDINRLDAFEERKVQELTQRLKADLGLDLFTKLYSLCKNNMSSHDMEETSDELEVRHSKDSSYLLEILTELQTHKKADNVSDVQQYIFSLKLLCAFERVQDKD